MNLLRSIANYFRDIFNKIFIRKSEKAKPVDNETKSSETDDSGIGTDILEKPWFLRTANLVITVLILCGIVFSIWYANQPEPHKYRMSIQAPGITPMRKNARPDNLIIRFNGSVAKLEDIEKEIKDGIEITPFMDGKWEWIQDNRIEFTPIRDWPAGTKFTVSLDKKLFPEHIYLKEYEKTFSTAQFSLKIVSNEFYIDPVNEDLKQVAATISFTHPVDPSSFEDKIELRPEKLDSDIKTFQNRKYKLNISYDDFFGKAYILSEALPMPEDNVRMKLTIKEGVDCAAEGEPSRYEVSSRVTIPGLTNYISINSIRQTMVRNEDYKLEQIITISTKGKARVALVGPEVIKLSKKIDLIPMQTEHEYEDFNSFKINAKPGKHLYVKIKKGTPFYGKYKLFKDYDDILTVQDYPKQLEIMHEGIILSSNGEKKVSLMAQGIDAVRFRIGKVQSDQLNHLVTQSNGDLTNIEFRNYNFSEENIVEMQYEIKSLTKSKPGEPNYFSFDFSKYLIPQPGSRAKYGIFFFEVKEWDEFNKRERYLGDKRLIMVSDLGVLIKDGTNHTHDVFVQSISSGQPVPAARVQVLGKNGIPVLSASTDINGHVSLPSLNSFRNEKSATVYLIKKGDDLTFMPVQAPGRWLNYSKFDVGGVHGASDPNKIDGYLFSDRGIYRPGDNFHIGMIVKPGNWTKSLSGTPLEAAILDARGLEIYKKKFKLSSSGFDELEYQTENTSPTGTYQINLYTIRENRRYRNIGSTTIKVEEFLPDRLTITRIFPGVGDKAWVSPANFNGLVTLRNLFGSPARGNRVTAEMTLSPGRMWFRQYRDYRFVDPLSSGKSFTETLPEKETDDYGKAEFNFNLGRFDAATYTLTFSANGFEKEGGRNVSTQSRVLVSPLPYLLGTKANGDLSYIYKNSERTLSVIAVNPELKKMAVSNIQFEMNELQHVSVLTKLPNGTYAYKSVMKRVPLKTVKRSIPVTGLNYTLPTSNPGEYELIIKNEEGMEFSRTHFSVVGMGNITRSLDKTAELDIKLNKTDYEPGEQIEVYVKAPYKGSGLITIERDKIYKYQWFNSQSNSFIKKIQLPSDLEGNGYINVSFVRAADSKEIYMSPLSYGIAPFSVSKKNKTNKISINIPNEARSGLPFPITYKSDKSSDIVIFAIDEGILQVAGYDTPDPLAHFFKKRALEVKTSQLLDLILPEFSLLQLRGAMGGGMDFEEIAKNLNPFKRKRHKPVAFWSGILKSDRQERTLNYTVPDYFNGTLRVMAVAVSQDAIGTFEEKAIVKNPYIISPNAPMFSAPGDSFQVTVTVTNSAGGSGKRSPVTLKVTSTNHLKVYNSKRKLLIDEDSDTTLTFNVVANNLPGSATLNFIATGPKETTSLASYMSVRPASPYQTRVTTGVIKDDDIDVETPRRLYEDYRVLNASVSFLPVGLSKGLVSYLDSYPYGCTEQVVSQAFPYLYLKDVNGFGISDKQAKSKIEYALKVLQARQNSDGKFGIWAANSHTSDFITVYGMHFITECKKAGYYVSEKLYNSTISALKDIAGQKGNRLIDLRVQAYAIYLLTANEIVTTNYIASVRKILDMKYKKWEKEVTGAYLAASYKIMKQEDEANSIFNTVAKSQLKTESSWYFCNDFIQNAQVLYLLSDYSPEALKHVSAQIISRLASYLENGGYNTITSSYTVLAFTTYAKTAGEPKRGKLSVTEILRNGKKQILNLPSGNFPVVTFSEITEKLQIENNVDLPLYYQVVQGGFDTKLPERRVNEGIEIYREFT
ncbi:MAG: alpha-2-macroglobulin, partial [Calditrichaceae bacterium]